MNNKILAISAVAILLVVGIAAGLLWNSDEPEEDGPITVTANGKTVTFDEPVEKMVIYSKYIAEAVILMGATDKVVGVSKTIANDTNYKQYYSNATNLGANAPSEGFDTVIKLQPDVIITYSTYDNDNAYNSGIPVLEIGASKSSEVQTDVEILGKILGMEDKAQKILDWFNKYYDIATSAKNVDDTRFLIESASKSKLTLCGPESTMGANLELIGGNNVVTEGKYQYWSADTVIPTDPEIILIVEYNANWNEEYLESYRDSVCSRSGWDQISAVKSGEVYSVSNDIFGGIRSVVGAVFMLSLIDSNYADLDVADIIDEYNSIAGTDFNNKLVYKN